MVRVLSETLEFIIINVSLVPRNSVLKDFVNYFQSGKNRWASRNFAMGINLRVEGVKQVG